MAINSDELDKALADVQTRQDTLNKATMARDNASANLAVAVTEAAVALDQAKAKAGDLLKEFNSQANGLLQ